MSIEGIQCQHQTLELHSHTDKAPRRAMMASTYSWAMEEEVARLHVQVSQAPHNMLRTHKLCMSLTPSLHNWMLWMIRQLCQKLIIANLWQQNQPRSSLRCNNDNNYARYEPRNACSTVTWYHNITWHHMTALIWSPKSPQLKFYPPKNYELLNVRLVLALTMCLHMMLGMLCHKFCTQLQGTWLLHSVLHEQNIPDMPLPEYTGEDQLNVNLV